MQRPSWSQVRKLLDVWCAGREQQVHCLPSVQCVQTYVIDLYSLIEDCSCVCICILHVCMQVQRSCTVCRHWSTISCTGLQAICICTCAHTVCTYIATTYSTYTVRTYVHTVYVLVVCGFSVMPFVQYCQRHVLSIHNCVVTSCVLHISGWLTS